MDTKERYWRSMLILFIVFLGVILFKEFWHMFAGLLGAFTIYVLVRKQMFFLTEKKNMNKAVAALLVLFEVILCILIPTFLIVWLLLKKAKNIGLNPSEWVASIHKIVDTIQQKIGYDLLNIDNVHTITTYVVEATQIVLGEVSSFVINALVLLFILYFMLINGRKMEAYATDIVPFSQKNKKSILKEVHQMTVSNAIGVPLLAVTQGLVVSIGFLIFGVNNVFLLGLFSGFASIIPVIGSAIVWIPVCIYLAATGNWFAAVGLALYSLIVLIIIDNVVRLTTQKKLANTHPLITIFGVIMGLSLFGFWGVIFGPIMLSMFFICIDIFKREFIDA